MKRLYPDQPLVGVGAVIIKDGRLLLEKRKNDPGRGKWSIPGGLVELGESLEQTILREVKEETGLEVGQPEHIDIVDNIDRDESGRIRYHFVILDYYVRVRGGSANAACDAEELRWVALDLVETYDLTKTFRAFFQGNREKLKELGKESI